MTALTASYVLVIRAGDGPDGVSRAGDGLDGVLRAGDGPDGPDGVLRAGDGPDGVLRAVPPDSLRLALDAWAFFSFGKVDSVAK